MRTWSGETSGMGRVVHSSKDPGLADCTMACRDNGSAGRVAVAMLWCSAGGHKLFMTALGWYRGPAAALCFSLRRRAYHVSPPRAEMAPRAAIAGCAWGIRSLKSGSRDFSRSWPSASQGYQGQWMETSGLSASREANYLACPGPRCIRVSQVWGRGKGKGSRSGRFSAPFISLDSG